MKNWDKLEADENLILNTHYTPGRAGRKINKVVLHHNGGNLSIRGCYDVWQTREASAHYQVDARGRIGQLVWDTDTAWHAGDYDANCTSIGIEHADISTSPWRISDATLDNGAHLVAAICKAYGLGRPQYGRNVFFHRDFSPTECPASIAGSQRDAYMRRAQEWYDKMTGKGKDTDMVTQQDIDKIVHGVWEYRYSKDKRKANMYDRVSRLLDVSDSLAGILSPLKKVVSMFNRTDSADANMLDDNGRGTTSDAYRRLVWIDKRVRSLVPAPADKKPRNAGYGVNLSEEALNRIAEVVAQKLAGRQATPQAPEARQG